MNPHDADGRTTPAAWAAMAALALLVFVWPMPHTIALRNLLLFVCLTIFGVVVIRGRGLRPFAGLRLPVAIYLVLTAWLLFVALFIARDSWWSLKEINSEWVKSGATMLLGVLVGSAARSGFPVPPAHLATLLVAVLFAHVLFIDVSAVYLWIKTEALPARVAGLMEHSAYANHVTNLLLVFLLAEMVLRFAHRRRTLLLPTPLLVLFVFAALSSAFFEQMRNGHVELGVILLLLTLLYWHEHRQRFASGQILTYVVLAVAVIGMFLYQSARQDERWRTLVQTIPIALDTEGNRAWLDPAQHPLPRLPDGQSVGHSNYMRIAWLKVGVEFALQNPWGVGYGRHAFGHAVEAAYGRRLGSSHSGLLDFAIGAGFVGVVLWCGFLSSVAYLGFRRYRTDKDFFGLSLLLLVVAFATRMVLDGTTRDHVLEQFLFLVGLFAPWMVSRAPVPAAVPRRRADR